MKTNERILRINSVLQNHFIKHPQSGMVLAKEFMPLFIENGIGQNPLCSCRKEI